MADTALNASLEPDYSAMPEFQAIVGDAIKFHGKHVPKEDIRQEAEYLILHPDFGGNWSYLKSKLNWYIHKFRQFSHVFRQVNLQDSELVVHEFPLSSDKARLGKVARARLHRDIVIHVAVNAGVSERVIADGVGCSRALVHKIAVADLRSHGRAIPA